MEYPTSPSALSAQSCLGHRLGGWVGAGLMASTLLAICPVAQAETLAAWRYDPATQQLTLTLPSGVTPQYTLERDPARIVLTIPETQVGTVATQQTYGGAIQQVHLSQVNADTVVTLDLAPNAVLTGDGATLVAIAAGDQTRWVLTALAAAFSPPPSSTAMIVELPTIPGNNSQLGFPAAGTGRLSTSAANLMLPSDIDNLSNLPETLPVDPFNLGTAGEQVSVPSLAELDAVVGPVAAAPLDLPAQAGAPTTAPLEAVDPGAAAAGVITLEPPGMTEAPPVQAPDPAIATPPEVATTPSTLAPIDGETAGLPIAVIPPDSANLAAAVPEVNVPEVNVPEVNTPEVNTPEVNTPEANIPAVAEQTPAGPAVPAPALPTVEPVVIASEPPPLPATENLSSAPELAAAPLPSLETLPPSSAPDLANAPASAIEQEPPAIATLPVAVEGTDPNLLAVPAAPSTQTQGTVLPPNEPIILAAAGEPILFGSPLPGGGTQAAYSGTVDPTPAERPLSPDTLIAAGTVLELQYVGDQPLDLNISSTQNQVLLLAHDIRDPMTNGIVAPAGSQLIGQFEPSPNGQRWVSKQLISPSGEQVSFATTTDYIVGNPAVSPPRLAAGAGIGALALLLLTGFTGIGLVGGALVGATTVVGTSPQHIVVEPNQIIQVQVMQDIPRAIPIAAASEYSREWGVGGW